MTTPEHPTAATMYCLGCGYCLDGLTESRCPECGRSFDPRDELAFVTHQLLDRERRLDTLLLISAVVAAGLVIGPMFMNRNLSQFIVIGIIVDLCVLGFGLPTVVFMRQRSSWRLSWAVRIALIPVVYYGLLSMVGYFLVLMA